jgi:hypothetical protein
MKRTPELFIAVVSCVVIAFTAAKLLGLVRLPAIAQLLGLSFAAVAGLMLSRIRRRPGPPCVHGWAPAASILLSGGDASKSHTSDADLLSLPEYSGVRKTPNRGLPADLAAKEKSGEHLDHREVISRSLLDPSRRPQADDPLFVALLDVQGAGFLTINLPRKGGSCLPIFSTPIRAADYVRTLLASGPSVKYLSSSPRQLVEMLRDLRGSGIEQVTLDRCPRCDIVTSIGSASVTTADRAVEIWSIFKASELARLDLYLSHAWASARAGQLDVARDVALETVAHVSLEDPRAHLLLGQIAVALRDHELLREARSFLQFLKLGPWESKLDEAARSGSPDFSPVA